MIKPLLFITVSLLLAGCSNSPQPIEYNHDSCSNCKMLITDNKYGAELVTAKGKIYKYDSIECLIHELNNGGIENGENASLWVTDFTAPGRLVNAEKAYYLKNDDFHSPMGFNALAVENHSEFEKMYKEFGGEKLNWTEIKDYNITPAGSKSSGHSCCPADEHS